MDLHLRILQGLLIVLLLLCIAMLVMAPYAARATTRAQKACADSGGQVEHHWHLRRVAFVMQRHDDWKCRR